MGHGSSVLMETCSGRRPPYGVRCRLTVGASRTSTPLRRASRASNSPIAATRLISQVAASDVADGMFAEASRSSQDPPRTPGRAGGGHQPAQPGLRLGVQRPEVGTGEQAELLLRTG